MNLKHLSNHDLHQQTKQKADGERLATIELLWHLREVERRMLFAQMGYPDLKVYCIKELKLSEGSAWRRINAMRLLKELPEVESKIQSGNLNLTQVTMARAHFREVKATTQEKKEILLTLENQSTRATERILAECKPEGYVPTFQETEKALRGQNLEVTFVLDQELQRTIEEIETLMGKKLSKLELFKHMAKKTLQDLRKKSASVNSEFTSSKDVNPQKMVLHIPQKNSKEEIATELSQSMPSEREALPAAKLPSKNSRYISASIRRFVSARDQGRCQYVAPVSKRQCHARFHLQHEHVYPFAKGGKASTQNLQLLCANHNKLRAIQVFGAKKMQKHLPSIRE